MYGDSSIKPEILGLDSTLSEGIYSLMLPLGLIVLFNGSDSLSDTDLLRRVGWNLPVLDILEIFLNI